MRTTTYRTIPAHDRDDGRLYDEAVGPVPPFRFNERNVWIAEDDPSFDPFTWADLALRAS
jgi:hypothetical protein